VLGLTPVCDIASGVDLAVRDEEAAFISNFGFAEGAPLTRDPRGVVSNNLGTSGAPSLLTALTPPHSVTVCGRCSCSEAL
jgi:hypothetical protein